jgi:hypothetical protein
VLASRYVAQWKPSVALANLRQILETLDSEKFPFKNLSKPEKELVWTLASSLISLISSLSEAQNEINQAISNRFTISQFLIGAVTKGEAPDYIVLEVFNCMAILLEDNKALAQQVKEREEIFLDYLIIVKQETDNKDYADMKGVGACQVLHNLFNSLTWYDHNTPEQGASDAGLIPTLVRAMNQTKIRTTILKNGDSKHSSPDQVIQLALELTAAIATSLQDALEHASQPKNGKKEGQFAGIVKKEEEFEGFDDTEMTNEASEVKDEEDLVDLDAPEYENGEMNEEEIADDMELVVGEGSGDDETTNETATLDLLIKTAAPQIISLLLQNNGNRSHALSALNNIAWAVSVIDFSEQPLKKDHYLESIYVLWVPVAQRIWDQIVSPFLASNSADIGLASVITSIAWALSRCVKGDINIQPGEQRKLMALHHSSKVMIGEREEELANAVDDGDDPFQSLGVKCIGALGSLALHPASIDLNSDIGIFLLTLLSGLPDVVPAEAVEALNQIFEIYGDENYAFDEPVFWGNDFCRRLEGIQPKLKMKAKSIDKRLLPELRDQVDEAVHNLHRFLSYKRRSKAADTLHLAMR